MKTIAEILGKLPSNDLRWILGNETKDALRYGFDHKRVVHAGMTGQPIMNPEEQQKAWQHIMNQPDEDGRRSVYIHVPFCEKKCSYCGFFQNASKKEVLNRYTDLVIKEIKQTAQYKRAQTGKINTVYFGGGTPSTLEPSDVKRLVQAVRDYLPLANDCEITLESRIHDMDAEHIEAAREGGVNRFSLGVQSFNTKIRQAVGRIDEEEVVIERLKDLLKANYASIVIDLMFGLPFQTWETWKHDLDTQFALGLHGGDIYQLNVFPNSDLATHIEEGKVDPCMTTPEQAELYANTVRYIHDHYPKILLFDPSHWAATRRERNIYNSMAKQRYDMFSFGSCAGGRVGNLSFMQHRDLNAYIKAMENGMKPIMMMLDDGGQGRLQGDLKKQLEDSYLDGKYFREHYDFDVTHWIRPVLDTWAEKGFITYANDIVRFTTAGMFWHDNLIQAVLECVSLYENADTHLRNENVAQQDKYRGERPSGHPAGVPKTGGMGGHPAGIPKTGGMGEHPAGVEKNKALRPDGGDSFAEGPMKMANYEGETGCPHAMACKEDSEK